jgi:hypothetical protein
VVQYQIKLRLTSAQEKDLTSWLPILTSVWNWAVRKIELDAQDHIYHSSRAFQNLLADHGPKLGIPSHTIQGMLSLAHQAWHRGFTKLARKPRLKGQRNKLNSIPFPDPFTRWEGNQIGVPGIGCVKFHKQWVPEGCIKCGRMVKRALRSNRGEVWEECGLIGACSTSVDDRLQVPCRR